MTRAAFERLVSEAVFLIPKRFRNEMRNIAIVVPLVYEPELALQLIRRLILVTVAGQLKTMLAGRDAP